MYHTKEYAEPVGVPLIHNRPRTARAHTRLTPPRVPQLPLRSHDLSTSQSSAPLSPTGQPMISPHISRQKQAEWERDVAQIESQLRSSRERRDRSSSNPAPQVNE